MNFAALILVPVIHLHLDGPPTLEKVDLFEPPPPTQWLTCVREYEAKAIRCYVADAGSMELYTVDIALKD